MKCPRCGCEMAKAMKGVGPQLWVCTNPECHHIKEEQR